MDVVCLAAGKGTRFGNLGRYLQKCMYPVGLRPFVEYSVRNLRRCASFDPGTDRLVFLVGHHGDQLRNYFGERYDGLRLQFLEQGDAGGTGHALRTVGEVLEPEAPTLFWLADLHVPAPLFDAIWQHPYRNVLTLAHSGADDNIDVLTSLDKGRVTRCWGGAGPLADIGLWKFEPAVLTAMTEPTGSEVRALPNLQRLIDNGLDVGWTRASEWVHLGGTRPTPEANVLAVTARVLELAGAAEKATA